MSQLNVDTIKKADGTGSLTVPAESGTVVVKDGSNDVTLNNITATGVYLGGTGAANYLDDYEKGTWTPSFSASTTNPSITYSYQHGSYTKIGDLVYYGMNVNGNISGGSGVLEVRGFPFPAANNSIYSQLGGGIIYGNTGASTVQYTLRLQPNTYYGYIQEYQDDSGDFAIDISSVQGTFVIQMSGVMKT